MEQFACEKMYIEKIKNLLQRDVLITLYCDPYFTNFNLVDFYYRKINQNVILMFLIIAFCFPMCFIAISEIAERYLSFSMQNLSRTFKLSPALAATTLIAFANGSSDIIAAYTYSYKPDAALFSIGTLAGGYIFRQLYFIIF